jgi:hypothetical protein
VLEDLVVPVAAAPPAAEDRVADLPARVLADFLPMDQVVAAVVVTPLIRSSD